ncbi:MAG: hypothetical protein AAFW69_02660 [Pseudomonadota bacterium]
MTDLDEAARAVLRANDRGGYTVPTAGLYPYQWNWDSAFAAWGFATFDTDRAWLEVETLMAGQWPSGMVPHILFHRPDPGYFPGPEVWGPVPGPIPSSGISQPAVAASAVARIWALDPDRARLAALFPRLLAWHRWWMGWRVSAGGAAFITHPWEAGRDNAPDWDGGMAALDPSGIAPYQRRDTGHVDAAMRPTQADYDRYVWLVERGRRLAWDDAALARDCPLRIADPTVHFILLRAMRDLRTLAAALGADGAEIAAWIARLEAGASELWNPATGAYDARDLLTGRFAGCVSNASFLAWWAGLDAADMLPTLQRILAASPHPVPSHDPASPRFEPRRYWRGPVWGILNCLIATGLAEQGHATLAERIRAATAALIEAHGFAEYFDPETGAPAGGGHFTWTAAIWLTWASPTAAR